MLKWYSRQLKVFADSISYLRQAGCFSFFIRVIITQKKEEKKELFAVPIWYTI